MRRITTSVLTVAMTLATAQAASAADIPAMAPITKAIWTWTGGYVGLHAGGAWMKGDGTVDATPSGLVPFGVSLNSTGFIGGAQWGYNYQLGSLVLGTESDLSGLSNRSSTVVTGSSTGGTAFTQTITQKLDWFGTTRARLGVALGGRGLIYGTAGIAYGRVTNDSSLVFPAVTYSGSRAVWQVGWAAGGGVEYAFAERWSAKVEYLYYDLGGGTVVGLPTPANPPFEIHTHLNLTGHIARVGVNYRPDWLAWLDPGAVSARASAVYAKAAPATIRNWDIQTGLRFWFSTGKTKKDLYDTTGAVLVSRLTYTDLDSISGETFGRIEHRSGTFLKGYAGMGALKRGNLQDEDFPPVVTPYSSTNSAQNDGAINYASADLGYTLLRASRYKVGAFVGYHYYREQVNAYGCAQAGGAGSAVCVPTIPNTILVISQDNKWHSVRLGLNGEVALTDRVSLSGDVAWLPYVWLDGADTHWLRLNQAGGFSGPTPEDGQGYGFQAEAILNVMVTENFNVGVGGRYWRMDVPDGRSHFEVSAIGGGSAQVEKWVTERYGGFAQASFKF